MFNLEKIFQKNDETYVLFIKISFFLVLFTSSFCAFYLKNHTNFYNFLEILGLENNPIYDSEHQNHLLLFRESNYYIATIIHLGIYFFIFLVGGKQKIYKKGMLNFFNDFFRIIFFSFLLLALLAIALKTTEQYSRVWFFSYLFISFIISFFLKLYFDFKYNNLITSNRIQRNVLLVGDIETCDEIAKNFSKRKNISIIKGIVPTTDDQIKDGNISSAPIFNLDSDFKKIIDYHHIGQIWIVSSAKSFYKTEKLIDKFASFAIDFRIVTKNSKYEFEKDISSGEGLEFYDISFSKFYGSKLLIKTILDKFFSLIALIIFFPIMLFFSILIVLEDGFPIFFIQPRTGWDGRKFNMFKFRSLKNDEQNTKNTLVEKGDKRILMVGRIIRRFSIDELPQFINVLKGDMAIVGPRPMALWVIAEIENDISTFLQRHKCPPGLTGWAQINGFRGRDDIKSLTKRYEHDVWYLKNWSVFLDLYIMFVTAFVIFTNKTD